MTMMWIYTTGVLVQIALLMPIVVYYSVKFGRFAWLVAEEEYGLHLMRKANGKQKEGA